MGNVQSLPHTTTSTSNRKRNWTGKELTLLNNNAGYYIVNLCKDHSTKTHYVHRLVAEHFIDNPNNFDTINHIDGNKHNNNISNLEWCTRAENMYHAWETGLCHSSKLTGNPKPVAKLDINTKKIIDVYYSIKEAAIDNGLKSPSGISMVLTNKKITAAGFKWKYITLEEYNQFHTHTHTELTSQQEEQTLEKLQTASRQSKEELSTSHNQKQELSKMTVSMMGMSSNKYEPSAQPLEISHTICARDWKGPNNFGFNGVVEDNE